MRVHPTRVDRFRVRQRQARSSAVPNDTIAVAGGVIRRPQVDEPTEIERARMHEALRCLTEQAAEWAR